MPSDTPLQNNGTENRYNIFIYDYDLMSHYLGHNNVNKVVINGYRRSFCILNSNRGTIDYPNIEVGLVRDNRATCSGLLLQNLTQENMNQIYALIDQDRNVFNWAQVQINGHVREETDDENEDRRIFTNFLIPKTSEYFLNPETPLDEKAGMIIRAHRTGVQYHRTTALSYTLSAINFFLKNNPVKEQELKDMITILKRTPAEEERRTRVSATHNKNKRGSEYLYVWWLFDNEEDYNTMKNHQIYPRDNGSQRVNYKEPGSKELDEALKGTKKSGKVLGQLLGYRDLTNRNVEFMNVVDPAPNFNEDHVIALGVAKINLYDFATKELRMGDIIHGRKDPTQHGLINSIWEYIKEGKMRFDPGNLKWHWARWNGELPGANERGLIRGRIVIRNENGQIPELNLQTPLQNAEAATNVYNHAGEIGLVHHVEAQVDGHAIAPAVQADEHGRFQIEIPRRNFGQQIILVSRAEDGYGIGRHRQGWPAGNPIILTVDHREFEHAIIPKTQSAGSRRNRLTIRPHPTIVNHTTPLQAPFGGQFVEIQRSSNNNQIRFDTNSNSGTQRNLRVFLYDVYNDTILTNNLLGQLGLTVEINIQGANNQTYVYNDDNAHPFPTNCNVTLRIDRNNNLPGNIPRFLMAVVAIQQGNEANRDVDQRIVEHMRYAHVNNENNLREQGVFDCNYSLILLR